MQQDKVLIVDDDQGIRETLSELIEELGYETFSAEDGLCALDQLENGPYLCVLTDIMMPNMTGLELIQKIKARDVSIPIIVITGYASLEIAIDAMKYGASDFISKPFKVKQIELLLNKMRREKQLLEENKRFSDQLHLHRLIDNLVGQLEDKTREMSSLQSMSKRIISHKGIRDLVGAVEDVTTELLNDAKAAFYPLNRATGSLFDPLAMTERTVNDEILAGNIFSESIPSAYGSRDFQTTFPLLIEGQLFGALEVITPVSLGDEQENKISYLLQRAGERMENVALYEGLYDNVLSTLNSMAKVIDARDPYTSQHSTRVTTLSLNLGKKVGLSSEDMDSLLSAASLHDIGKVGIPDHILLKPDRLTDEEYLEIQKHPDLGADIIQPIIPMRNEAKIIRHHHERYDGRGYPARIGGEEIPLLSRIIALADSYDAMTSDRPYRKGLPVQKAVDEIIRCKGSQFDPRIADIFVDQLKTDA